MTDVLRLGVLAWQVQPRPVMAAWASRLEIEVAHAAQAGAQMLLMPEYAPVEMACQPAADLSDELSTACDLAQEAIAAAAAIARRHRIWLLPGSFAMRSGPDVHNRAPLISPSGLVAFQDKHVMTRFEAETWRVSAGPPPSVFPTPWGLVGIAICYDLEFPALVRAQVEAGAWLILSPVCTDTRAGFNRVRIAARARAMENQCFVALAPTVGAAPKIAALDANHGAAGVFGPVDHGFADDGVVAEGAMDQGGWLFVDLDPSRLGRVRAEGAVRNHADHPAVPQPCATAVFA